MIQKRRVTLDPRLCNSIKVKLFEESVSLLSIDTRKRLLHFRMSYSVTRNIVLLVVPYSCLIQSAVETKLKNYMHFSYQNLKKVNILFRAIYH